MSDSKFSTHTNIVTDSNSSYGRSRESISESDSNSSSIVNSYTDSIKTTSEKRVSLTKDCTKEELIACLQERDSLKIDELIQSAYKIKAENIGKKVYLRGVIELSNICTKNCYFCGIRQLNSNIDRFELTENQVIEA